MNLEEKITHCAKKFDADMVCFGGRDRFSDTAAVKIFPELGTVIGLGFRVLRGSHRGIEEGSTYYQYSTTGVETIEETVMPQTLLRVSALLEDEGYIAIPQRRHQTVMQETDGINPEVFYDDTFCGAKEIQLNFDETAVLCGLGERGLHGAVLTDRFGPFVRWCFVLTDAVLAETPLAKTHLCDRCGECVKACPGGAIAEDGTRNDWQCAAYYKGANRSRNPFMPEDAFADMENRREIMEGKAKLSPEQAKRVMDETYFYPPIKHAYVSSICGRACDVACYVHLEEKGLLESRHGDKFRKRPRWKLDV